MSLSPLLLCGHDNPSRLLSVSGYREPGLQARISYAPTGEGHGDIPLAWSYQQTLHGFNVFDELGTTEADAREKVAELAAAIGRLSYSITVTIDDADPETWTCDPGSIAPADDRSYTDLVNHNNIWAVQIPAYPIRSV